MADSVRGACVGRGVAVVVMAAAAVVVVVVCVVNDCCPPSYLTARSTPLLSLSPCGSSPTTAFGACRWCGRAGAGGGQRNHFQTRRPEVFRHASEEVLAMWAAGSIPRPHIGSCFDGLDQVGAPS